MLDALRVWQMTEMRRRFAHVATLTLLSLFERPLQRNVGVKCAPRAQDVNDVNLAAVQNDELVQTLLFLPCAAGARAVHGGRAYFDVSRKDIEMKITPATVFVLFAIVSPTALLAQTPPTMKVEGIKTKSAGSLNPPNPTEACNEAKKNAIEKAASAGFKGKVVWDKLSGGDDCKLTTMQAGHVG